MYKKVAVITNADEGLGVKLTKTLCNKFDGAFYFTTKDEIKGMNLVNELKKQGLTFVYHQLDISDRQSILRFRDHLQQNYGGLNLLVNNVAIPNKGEICEVYEKAKLIIKEYYYNYVEVQELLYPLLQSYSRVVYVTKRCNLECVKHDYWLERLSMKHFGDSDINDFLQWFLNTIKTGTFDHQPIIADPRVAPYKMANVALHLLVSLQQKRFQPRCISVEFLYPTYTVNVFEKY